MSIAPGWITLGRAAGTPSLCHLWRGEKSDKNRFPQWLVIFCLKRHFKTTQTFRSPLKVRLKKLLWMCDLKHIYGRRFKKAIEFMILCQVEYPISQVCRGLVLTEHLILEVNLVNTFIPQIKKIKSTTKKNTMISFTSIALGCTY